MKEEKQQDIQVNKEEKTDKSLIRKRILSSVIIVLFLAVLVVVFIKVGKPLVAFVTDSEQLRAWVDDNWLWSRLAYIGIVMLQIFVAVIPGEPFEIAAGYAFGAVEGTIICLIGSALGGTLVFLLVRKFGVKLVEVFISVEKMNSLKFLQDSKKRDVLIFLLFFIPGTPKDALTYFAGLTKMELKNWIIITTVAKFPAIVTSTVGGNAIGGQNYMFAIIVFAITFILSAVGMVFYNQFTKRKQEEIAATKEEQE
ncbi:MAG: TVP38/TMEM64 family protein [Lachnospiraceae bacterium]|nr:TVP38/TMEM64 family protein [Lachnospiraceae bacterium]